MAVPARSESPLAVRRPATSAANDGYGSLMGMGAPRKKKKPVLVLDAEELQKAHEAIAMGGAQIMETAGEAEAAERVAPTVSLLGLAPMGADDSGQEDTSAYPPIPDAASWQDEEEDFEGEAGFAQLPDEPEEEAEAFEEAERAEEFEEAEPEPAVNLEHLLRPAAPETEVAKRSSVIPSIEEQLKRMKALPTPEPVEQAVQETTPGQDLAPRRAGPMEQLGESAFGVSGFSLSGEEPGQTEDEPQVALEATEPAGPPEIEPQPEIEPEPEIEAEVAFEAPVEAAPAEPVEEPLELEAFSEEPVAADDYADEDFDDGPDLSWMEPEQRRKLEISEGRNSNLRARLVQANDAEDYALPPGLLARLRTWFAGLFGR